MKKIVLVMVTIILLHSCDMFKKYDYVVSNKSDYEVRIDVKTMSGDKLSESIDDSFMLKTGEKKIIIGFDNMRMDLGSVGRYTLKKISMTNYEITNTLAVKYTVYNKANEVVILNEKNNLFDEMELNANENKDIDIFADNDFSPIAKTKVENLNLKVVQQEKKIVISF